MTGVRARRAGPDARVGFVAEQELGDHLGQSLGRRELEFVGPPVPVPPESRYVVSITVLPSAFKRQAIT